MSGFAIEVALKKINFTLKETRQGEQSLKRKIKQRKRKKHVWKKAICAPKIEGFGLEIEHKMALRFPISSLIYLSKIVR